LPELALEELKAENSRKKGIMEQIIIACKQVIALLQAQLEIKTIVDKKENSKEGAIEKMALAIKDFEDWVEPGGHYRDGRLAPHGSLSYRNKNPGNLKFADQIGATGKDQFGHAIFATEEYGWQALLNQLCLAFEGRSKNFKPEMMLYNRDFTSYSATPNQLPGFFQRYAEGNSKEYSEFVAEKLDVPVTTRLNDLT